MGAVNLTVDVHCDFVQLASLTRNSVNFDNISTATAPISYRVYLNDLLLIERPWVWNNNTLIRENILVDLPIGVIHQLHIEPVLKNLEQVALFKLINLATDNTFIASQINDLHISFTLQ
jgi:hypothetical protein